MEQTEKLKFGQNLVLESIKHVNIANTIRGLIKEEWLVII